MNDLKRSPERRGNAAQAGQGLLAQGRADFREKRRAAISLHAEIRRLIEEWDGLIREYTLLAGNSDPDNRDRDQAFFQLRERLTSILLALHSNRAIMARLRMPQAEAEFGLVESHALRRLLDDDLPREALASLFITLEKAAAEIGKAAPDSPIVERERRSRRQDREPER